MCVVYSVKKIAYALVQTRWQVELSPFALLPVRWRLRQPTTVLCTRVLLLFHYAHVGGGECRFARMDAGDAGLPLHRAQLLST